MEFFSHREESCVWKKLPCHAGIMMINDSYIFFFEDKLERNFTNDTKGDIIQISLTRMARHNWWTHDVAFATVEYTFLSD